MLGWLFGKKTELPRRPRGVPAWVPDELVDGVGLVQAYWTFDPAEWARLTAQQIDALAWPDLLRLHHLNCLRALETGPIRHRLETNEVAPPDDEATAALERCRQSAERLLGPDSPYRPRDADVWLGALDPVDRRRPDRQGVLCNASLTHLGSLEVLRLDGERRPAGVAFVAFDDLQTVALAAPAPFRPARLFYDDGRPDEIVLVPLQYATSWRASSPYLRDGRITQFLAHPPGGGPAAGFGLGVGRQDLAVSGADRQGTVGLGSASQVTFALDPADPRFALKCRARGLDPDELLRGSG